jgi:hypothetical protein
MVTFNDSMPYSVALETGAKQRKIMDAVMKKPNVEKIWESLNFGEIVDRLDSLNT